MLLRRLGFGVEIVAPREREAVGALALPARGVLSFRSSSLELNTKARAAYLGHVVARNAHNIAAPYQAKIAPWQEKLARLRAFALIRGEADHGEELASLLPLVVALRIEFEAEVDGLDERIKSHSVIVAVRNSLIRLREELDALT